MRLTILLIFLATNLMGANAVTQCCPGKNIVTINGTCWDQSNITFLPCETQILIGPSQDPPATIKVEIDDTLTIVDELNTMHVQIASDRYCITRESENDMDVALVCAEITEQLSTTTATALFYLKVVCGFISVLFLFTVLVIYLFVPGLQDVEGKCISNLIASLFVAFIVIIFLPIIGVLIHPYPCDTTAFIYFTSTLCCVNWLSVISFHLWRITILHTLQAPLGWFVIYCSYGYGLPVILLITALILHYSQDRKLRSPDDANCFFKGNGEVWAYFYGPLMVMILVSMVLQLWAAKKVWLDIDRTNRSQPVLRLRKKSLMYLHLLLVVGAAYVLDTISFAFVNINKYLNYMWDVVDCRNLLIGGAIFFILVVQRTKVLKALAKRGLFCMTFPKNWEMLIDEENEVVDCEEATLTQDNLSDT